MRARLGTALALVVGLGATLSSPAPAAEGPHKIALVVAIAQYPEASGYKTLNTDHDVPYIVGALQRQGFKKSDIHVLRDADATHDGIVAAFQKYLIDEAHPGDVAVFHYSGHGHQITDDNGDEIDGYDEVLVPYGAPASMANGYDGSKHLRDDELGKLLDQLRTKIGPTGDVLVTIDACHSGSATRGGDDGLAVRGGLPPMGAPAKSAKKGATPQGSGMFEAGKGGGLAPYVVISAARDDEPARETRDPRGQAVGALSLAFSDAVARGHKGETYRQLFASIQAEMASSVPKQTPQLEGDVDTKLFSGDVVEQTPYFTIDQVADDGSVLVNGGSLVGVLPGTEVAFHPAGTLDPSQSKAIVTGTVSQATETQAKVTLATPTSADKLKDAQVFVTRYSLGDLKVKVVVDPAVAGAKKDAIAAAITPLGIAQMADAAPDVVVAPSSEKGKVHLVAADGTEIAGPFDVADAELGTKVADAVRKYARNRYLKGMDMRDDAVKVSLDLVPAKHHYAFDGSCESSDPVDPAAYQSPGHEWTLHPGDGYLLKFTNDGPTPAYVTVLDLMADGSIEQLYPRPEFKGTDNYLQPGQSFTLNGLCFEATEPYGTEMLKLFATRSKVDFEPVIAANGVTRGAEGALDPLQQVLADAWTGTRSKVAAVPRQTGSTYALTIDVVKPDAPTPAGTP